MIRINLKEVFAGRNDFITKDIYLFPIQMTGLMYLKEIESKIGLKNYCQGCVFADDMGCGKSHIMACLCLLNPVYRTIFITPKNTLCQISERLLEICSPGLSIYRCHNGKYEKAFINEEGLLDFSVVKSMDRYSILVTNREQLGAKDFLSITKQEYWFRIIIDEAQEFRNNNTFTRELSNLRKGEMIIDGKTHITCSTILSTGTPIENDIEDLVNLYRIIDDSFFKGKTKSQYSESIIREYNQKYLFRRTVDQFTDELKLSMGFPLTKPEEITYEIELPETQFSRYVENMPWSEILDCYSRNVQVNNLGKFRDLMDYDERAFIISATEKQRVNRVNNTVMTGTKIVLSNPFKGNIFFEQDDRSGNIFGNDVSEYKGLNSKVEKLKEVISSSDCNSSYVIFYEYERTKDIFLDGISGFKDFETSEIDGSLTAFQRHEVLTRCNREISQGKKKILASSIPATYSGVCYSKFGKAFFVDQGANPQKERQLIARLQRIGQLGEVVIYFITYAPFKTYSGVVNSDRRLREIKDGKLNLMSILEPNASFYFKRYYFPNSSNVLTSGIRLPDEYESKNGLVGGADSQGPDEILEFSEKYGLPKEHFVKPGRKEEEQSEQPAHQEEIKSNNRYRRQEENSERNFRRPDVRIQLSRTRRLIS